MLGWFLKLNIRMEMNMENVSIEIASDSQINGISRKVAGVISKANNWPFYLAAKSGRLGQLSSRVFATLKAKFDGNVPSVICDALYQDCENNLSSETSKEILKTLQVEDLIARFNGSSAKPRVKAKTSTKPKPTAKVTSKDTSKSLKGFMKQCVDTPEVNAFAKSLEINLKALDQKNEQSEEIEAIQESLRNFELAKS